MKLIITTLIFGMFACGTKGGSKTTYASTNPLLGAWSTNCSPDGDSSFKAEIQINDKEIHQTLKGYSDSECKEQTVLLTEIDSYSLPGGNKVDFIPVVANLGNDRVVGQSYFTIYLIKDNKLYTGASSPVEVSRPTAVDLSVAFIKQ